jgi:hypothetical protein
MNDLENIIPFVLLAGLYLATRPSAGTAGLLFKIFTAARYIHTFVYLFTVSFIQYSNSGCYSPQMVVLTMLSSILGIYFPLIFFLILGTPTFPCFGLFCRPCHQLVHGLCYHHEISIIEFSTLAVVLLTANIVF